MRFVKLRGYITESVADREMYNSWTPDSHDFLRVFVDAHDGRSPIENKIIKKTHEPDY